MENLEKGEKIREKTGVSYEDARNALNACNNDILEAIIYLEKLGKIEAPAMTSYTTGDENKRSSEQFADAQEKYHEDCKNTTVKGALNKFFNWCGELFKKCNEIKFRVTKNEEKLGEVPLLILILLIVCCFWITIPLLIIGLFFNFKYSFSGVNEVTVDINKMCDKATEACTNIKNDMMGNKENE